MISYTVYYVDQSAPEYILAVVNARDPQSSGNVWETLPAKEVACGYVPSDIGEDPREWVFERFNIGEAFEEFLETAPEGYRRSMSPGDIVVLFALRPDGSSVERKERCLAYGWDTEEFNSDKGVE
jgi:hypothetical protein